MSTAVASTGKNQIKATVTGAIPTSAPDVRMIRSLIRLSISLSLRQSAFAPGRIQKGKCAVGLSDVVMNQLNHSFLVGLVGYRVEGDLIIDTTLPGCASRV